MKKIASIALILSLVSTAASAVTIDVTVDGATRRINCGTPANLSASGLPAADIAACSQFFSTAAGAGAGAGAGAAGAAAFGVGGAGTIALAGLGIALVAGFGGSNGGGGGSSSNSTTN